MSSSTFSDRPASVTTTAEAMAPHGSGAHIHRRISWAAVVGGVVLVVVLQLLFSLLGAGVGLGTVNTNAGSTPMASTLGIGAGIWWILTSCLAIGVGGFVAAWFAGVEIRFDGVLHGLVTWGIATTPDFLAADLGYRQRHWRRLLGSWQCRLRDGQRRQ